MIAQFLGREVIGSSDCLIYLIYKECRKAGEQDFFEAINLRDLRKPSFPEFLLSYLPKILHVGTTENSMM